MRTGTGMHSRSLSVIMKNRIKILGLILLVFILITLLTMKIETPFDGNDTYGFPFDFHKKLSGMTFPIPENHNTTHIGYLIVDFVFSGILVFGILSLRKKTQEEK